MSALNADGIVHRDVKPDNIMLTPDGHGGQVVKLIDFGVARLTEAWDVDACETPAPRPRTKLGLVVGTPGYMPPEAGYEPPCERYDVYGLAATLWELATGERAGIRHDDQGDMLCVESSAYVRVMKRLCKHLGIPYKATHILRKTCATALAKAGLGSWAIADHLGHSGTEMAKVYVDRHYARNDRVAAALDAYPAGVPSLPSGREGNR